MTILTLLLALTLAAPRSAPIIPAGYVDAASRTSEQTGGPVVASWYVDARKAGYYAAMHAYRWGMAPWRVRVCRADRPAVCVVVRVSDHCQCLAGTRRERGIDLSRLAFSRLAAPAVGLVRVTLRRTP